MKSLHYTFFSNGILNRTIVPPDVPSGKVRSFIVTDISLSLFRCNSEIRSAVIFVPSDLYVEVAELRNSADFALPIPSSTILQNSILFSSYNST